MKKIILSVLFIITSSMLFAQSQEYITNMKSNILRLKEAQTLEQFRENGNTFERIANVEKKEWLPLYYSSYCKIMEAMFGKTGTQDALLDKADAMLDNAINLYKNDELLVLKAFSKSARIMVDPMTRGAKYGMESNALLEEAKKMNPENPRIYFLQGQSKFYTPEAFGGGKSKARDLFQTAIQKFEAINNEVVEEKMMPTWGLEQARAMLEACDK